mgnify:FL=1
MDHEKEKILVRREKKMSGICVRKATECDLEAVEKIYDKIHDAEESSIVPTTFNGLPDIHLVLLEKHLA